MVTQLKGNEVNRKLKLSFAIFVAATSLILHTGSASAKFEKSDEKLFIDWLDLEVNPDSTFEVTEFSAYAIVWSGGENLPVVYVITSDYKGKVSVLGAFRCDKEFRVMKSQTRGMRDIRCVRQDVFGQKTTTMLRYNDKGLYEEHF